MILDFIRVTFGVGLVHYYHFERISGKVTCGHNDEETGGLLSLFTGGSDFVCLWPVVSLRRVSGQHVSVFCPKHDVSISLLRYNTKLFRVPFLAFFLKNLAPSRRISQNVCRWNQFIKGSIFLFSQKYCIFNKGEEREGWKKNGEKYFFYPPYRPTGPEHTGRRAQVHLSTDEMQVGMPHICRMYACYGCRDDLPSYSRVIPIT